MTQQELLKWAAEEKVKAEYLAGSLTQLITNKAHEIRLAISAAANVSQLQAEMKDLQDRLSKEPEEATECLCLEIERRTGIKDIFRRNTDATNKNLKGENWATFVLGLGLPSK